MNWLTLTLISVVIVSFSNVLQRVLMKNEKSDSLSYAFVFHFSIGILYLLIALVQGMQLPELNFGIFLILISAALWGTGSVLCFKALKLLESSEVTIITSIRSVVTIIASIFILHELFNVQKMIGTAIILLSVVFVTNLKKGFKFNKGVIFAICSTLFTGSAVVVDSLVLRSLDPISYLAIANLLIGALLLLFSPKTIYKLQFLKQKRFLASMLPIIFLSTAQAIAFYYALRIGNASQIAPIAQSQVIVTVFLAAILLKERDHVIRKMIAAGLVMVGVLLLR